MFILPLMCRLTNVLLKKSLNLKLGFLDTGGGGDTPLYAKYRRHTDPNGGYDQNEIKRNKALTYFKQNALYALIWAV